MNELDGADIYTAGRLGREQNSERLTHLSGDHDLLLISTGKIAGCDLAVGRTDVELGDLCLRVFPDSITVEHASTASELFLAAENEVVGDRIVEDETAMMPVFRNVR